MPNIKELTEQFLTEKSLVGRILPSSEKTYAALLGSFVKFCGDDADLETAAAKVDQYLVARGAELGDHAFAKNFQVLRALFKFARQKGNGHNPLEGRRAPMIHDSERIFLSEDQVMRLLEATAISGRLHARRDAALQATLYFGLLRVGEATHLLRRQVDLGAGELLVMGKGHRQRRVPICAGLARFLSRWMAKLPPEAPVLFPAQAAGHDDFGILDNARVEYTLRKVYAPAAGLAGLVTPHTLRRSAANRLLKRGVGLTVIQRLLGHRRIETTLAYLGVSAEELREGVLALDGLPLEGLSVRHDRVTRSLHPPRG